MAPTNFDPAAYPIISQHWFGLGPFRPISAERGIRTVVDQKLSRYAELNPKTLEVTGATDFWPEPLHEVGDG